MDTPSLIRSIYPVVDINAIDKADIMDKLSIFLSNYAKNIPESIPALFIILAIGLIQNKRNNKGKEEER